MVDRPHTLQLQTGKDVIASIPLSKQKADILQQLLEWLSQDTSPGEFTVKKYYSNRTTLTLDVTTSERVRYNVKPKN